MTFLAERRAVARAAHGTVAFQSTLIASAQAAGHAFDATTPGMVVPGYDAAQNDAPATPAAQFEKTSVMQMPGAADTPPAGGGKTDQAP